MTRTSAPVAQVRRRLEAEFGPEVARTFPDGYHRVGSVVLLRLPPSLLPIRKRIGEIVREELQSASVLLHRGPVEGDLRTPVLERLTDGPTETEVVEFGIRYRLDAASILFSRGNRTERHRAGEVTCPGETVIDLFAGIGYFAVPAAVLGKAAHVVAVETNPVAFHYLEANVRLNRVESLVEPRFGDNRTVFLPVGTADRVFLGFLPNSRPWLPRAIPLLRDKGGVLHIHLTSDVRQSLSGVELSVEESVREAGGRLLRATVRVVKPYGPGRNHVVVDAHVVPTALGPGAHASTPDQVPRTTA